MRKNYQNIESIFMLKKYDYQGRLHYPMFKIHSCEEKLFKTLKEAEDEVMWYGEREVEHRKECPDKALLHHYAYVITELILGRPFSYSVLGDCLSERVYLPDGTLWCKNDSGSFIPHDTSVPEEYNYWGRRNIFHGRRPEEIRFKPGDLVEVFGYPGNDYWNVDEVNLAIVVKTPPTMDEATKMQDKYMATHTDYDLTDHSLGYRFDHSLDVYMVLPYNSGVLDRSPTIATMRPSLPITTGRKKKLLDQYEKYLAKSEKNIPKIIQ